jgi:hypothetical protein
MGRLGANTCVVAAVVGEITKEMGDSDRAYSTRLAGDLKNREAQPVTDLARTR